MSTQLTLRPVCNAALWLMGLACAALLQGCQTAPVQSPGSPAGYPSPAGGAAPAPAPGVEPAPQAAPVNVPRESEISGLLTAVRNNLDAGQEDAAVADLERVLAFDPQQKAASTLLRQVREDPVALYGRESFVYRVQSGDTLATIAQRFMNDRDQFYGLARYNDIKVPRQLPVGQSIRIPGKQPRVVPPPVPSAAPAAPPPAPPVPSTAAPVAPPPQPAAPPAAIAPDPRLEQAREERARKASVAAKTRQARAAMARQDVCGAIAAWNEVLKLEPDNRTAVLERERALDLKRRLPSAKC